MICNTHDLVARWHRQIGARRPYCRCRKLAALAYRLHEQSPDTEDLIELRHVELVLLFDEPIGRRVPALRLVGYGGSQIPHGVQWGGPDNAKYYKDLRLEPACGSTGLRMDATSTDLLRSALQLRADLYRVDRIVPKSARSAPVLPRLWAAFAPAASPQGDGPELAALCSKFGLDHSAMLEKFRRERHGLSCFPLDWVSSELHKSLAVYVDLSEMPQRQVFRLHSIPEDLQGFSGAAAFDFYSSRHREHFEQRLRQCQSGMKRPAVCKDEHSAATP